MSKMSTRRADESETEVVEEPPKMKPVATLYVYGGKFGLPSIDPKCLHILFHLRMHPTNIVKVVASSVSLSPKLPCLKYKSKLITNFEDILEVVFDLVKPHCDDYLADEEKARMETYKNLSFRILESPMILNFWGIPDNIEYFADLYSQTAVWLLQDKFKRNILDFYEQLVADILRGRSINQAIAFSSTSMDTYFEFVTYVLGDKKFLLGSEPSTFDAQLCGYLAPLLTYNCPINRLQRVLRRFNTVVKYVNNYVNIYGDRQHGTDYDEGEEDYSSCSKFFMFHISLVFFASFLGTMWYHFFRD